MAEKKEKDSLKGVMTEYAKAERKAIPMLIKALKSNCVHKKDKKYPIICFYLDGDTKETCKNFLYYQVESNHFTMSLRGKLTVWEVYTVFKEFFLKKKPKKKEEEVVEEEGDVKGDFNDGDSDE